MRILAPLLALAACAPGSGTLDLTAEPGSIDLGGAVLDDGGAHTWVTVTNSGDVPLTVTSAAITDAGRRRLEVSADLPMALAPDAWATIDLRVLDLTALAPGAEQTLVVRAIGEGHVRGGGGAGNAGSAEELRLEIPIVLALPAACDVDGDGYADPFCGGNDCDDGNLEVHPARDELCNTVDDDCDGAIDESAVDPTTWYADADRDGFGDDSTPILVCFPPFGYVGDATDCSDANPRTWPGADEICDGLDNDCDGTADEDAVNAATWFVDGDGDGFGDAGTSVFGCEPPGGAVVDGSDCDDADPAVRPGTVETCDGEDDDCDATVDEDAIDAPWWFTDADGDGAGDPYAPVRACEVPAGAVDAATDCDDTDAAKSPSATEVCNGADDDCDGQVDEEGPGSRTPWWRDRDGDGFGDPAARALACGQPAGHVGDDTDCDDLAASTFPGAAEVCDDEDQDCDGEADEGLICVEICGNGLDDDGNGDTDCEDAACVDTCVEICGNGLDDDGNGLTDCEDAVCADTCVEICGNGLDDDGNGLVDCEDAACVDTCTETVCDDGQDDDGDGAVDCDDDDCLGTPGCLGGLTVQVTGGAMSITSVESDDTWKCDAGIGLSFWQVDRRTMRTTRARDVQGVAQALGPAGSVVASCDWKVGYASAVFVEHDVSGTLVSPRNEERADRVRRADFSAESGCGLTEADLPRLLAAQPDATVKVAYGSPSAYAPSLMLGPLWYVGAAIPGPIGSSASVRTFTFDVGGFPVDCVANKTTRTQPWDVPTLSPGEPFSP